MEGVECRLLEYRPIAPRTAPYDRMVLGWRNQIESNRISSGKASRHAGGSHLGSAAAAPAPCDPTGRAASGPRRRVRERVYTFVTLDAETRDSRTPVNRTDHVVTDNHKTRPHVP